MEIVLLIGGRAYPLPQRSALYLCDRIRQTGSDERTFNYLAESIEENLATGESMEPIELGNRQIEPLADILWPVDDPALARLRIACERYLHPG